MTRSCSTLVQAPEIHRAFQRDLCKMRLETARAYVKTLSTDGSGHVSVRSCQCRGPTCSFFFIKKSDLR